MSRVIIFTLPACGTCKQVMQYLKKQKIPFHELDAMKYREYLLKNGFYAVPVLQIDSTLYYVSSLTEAILILQKNNVLPCGET